MSGKSRRGRARQTARSKNVRPPRPVSEQLPVAAAQPAAVKATPSPTGRLQVRASAAGVSHTHVIAELRRIGIMAGIMLAILVILVLVLP